MVILASLQGLNLFSSLPSTPPPNDQHPSTSLSPSPPIPIPKYPPSFKSQRRKPPQNVPQNSSKPPPNPALKSVHRRSNYYKPVRDGIIASDNGRSVVIGNSGVSYLLPGAPFEFQYSYSETPKVKPLAIRKPAFLPFTPPTMPHGPGRLR